RDYIEQLREEGLDGLPASKPPAAAPTRPQSGPVEAASTSAAGKMATPPSVGDEQKLIVKADEGAPPPQSPLATPSNVAGELFYRYPGLEKTADLGMLREFIGDCTRCKLAPGRTKLVFGAGNPNAELMFVGEAPGADEDLRGEPFVG